MISRPVVLILCISFLKASLFAQTSFGVEGGLCYNIYHTNIANRPATTLEGRPGFALGVLFRYYIYPGLFITAIPGVLQKGYSMQRTDSLSGEYDQHTNTYLQAPIGIGWSHEWKRMRLELSGGPFVGYWLYGHIKGSTADVFSGVTGNGAAGQGSEQFQLRSYSGSYSFLSQRDNRWEAGWWLGPGMQYRLTSSCRLTAGAKYYQSLTSQGKSPVSPIPAYNRTWTFTIGCLWWPGKSKPRT